MAKKRLNRNQFTVINQKGRLIAGELFSTKVLKLTSGFGHYFAVVVSGRVDKRAVGRNKLKRRLYALLEAQKVLLPDDLGLILFTKGAARDATYTKLRESISALLPGIR